MKDILRTGTAPRHIFTIDVEEYFQVGAFESFVARDHWNAYRSRAVASMELLLDVLARFEVKATCFVLGWLAKRHPEVVRDIAAQGHEVASHGWSHRSLCGLDPSAFREEVRTSKALLEDIAGKEVIGFRAPNFSIVNGGEWAFDILLEEGYRYDSSLFAHRHRVQSGYPGALTVPHRIVRAGGSMLELPIAALAHMGISIPAAGGGYFRHFPYAVTRDAFRRLTEQGVPGVFYIHPWELDPEQPRIGASLATRVRHYAGISHTRERLEHLLSDFAFTSVERHPELQLGRMDGANTGLVPLPAFAT